MPRKPRMPRRAKQKITPALRTYLETGRYEKDAEGAGDAFLIKVSSSKLKKEWESFKDEILLEYIHEHPCKRPWGWWLFESPRWWDDPFQGCYFHGLFPEPRQRIGGTGTPNYEVLAYVPHFDKGIPTGWISKFDEDYYNGRAKDINGNPIGTKYKEGHFKGKAIDPDNSPCFESEAAYLDRHGLLTDFEKRHLAKHPELLEPETVNIN